MKANFSSSFSESITDKLFEKHMQRSVTPVSTIWKTSYTQKFAQSTMGTLIKKPNHDVVQTLNDKTKALQLMSLDLSSSGKFNTNSRFI